MCKNLFHSSFQDMDNIQYKMQGASLWLEQEGNRSPEIWGLYVAMLEPWGQQGRTDFCKPGGACSISNHPRKNGFFSPLSSKWRRKVIQGQNWEISGCAHVQRQCEGVGTCKVWRVGWGPDVQVILTFADLYNSHDDDQGQGQELPSCENVLNPGGPTNTGTVDPCEEHWNDRSPNIPSGLLMRPSAQNQKCSWWWDCNSQAKFPWSSAQCPETLARLMG